MIPWPIWLGQRFNPSPPSGEARAAYWEDSAAHWREMAETLEVHVAELEAAIHAALNLNSSYERERFGRSVPLINNVQARMLLEDALKGKGADV